LKELDDVSDVAGEHRPDESGKSPGTPSKATVIREDGVEDLSLLLSVQMVFCGCQNFESIVICAPPHVSKFSRVVKRLTT
jgi:hypothetical protein